MLFLIQAACIDGTMTLSRFRRLYISCVSEFFFDCFSQCQWTKRCAHVLIIPFYSSQRKLFRSLNFISDLEARCVVKKIQAAIFL